MTVNKTIKSTLLVLTIIAAALLPAQTILGESNAKSPDYKELRLFREVMGIVQKHYVKDVPDKELVQGAINGMLQSLDPHSQVLKRRDV